MLSPFEFREIISGRRRGLGAMLWRSAFSIVEPFYSTAVRYRNWRYDTGRSSVTRVEVPVISVGNLTLGGTGKTPMVEWLARWFLERGVRVALVSRGYGGNNSGTNDEALELHQKLPDIPHVLNPRRAIGAREAIDKHAAQLLILDDGFQHRRLARDLDIVLIDALEPFGFEHVFPRGTLREPLAGFARAQVIALSRADAVDEAARRALRERVRAYNPDAVWLELSHAPRRLQNADGDSKPLELLRGKRLLAFCGIGNPAGFRHALASCGYEVVDFREFPDHHAYVPADIAQIDRWAEQALADAVICTHKDLVKVQQASLASRPLWALAIGLEILSGRDEFERRLDVLATRARSLAGKDVPQG